MYVVYNVKTKLIVKSYKTEHGANIHGVSNDVVLEVNQSL
jgi:hypothetical protein